MTRIFLDVGRLVVRGNRSTATGIDRVVLAYARWLLTLPPGQARAVVSRKGRIAQISDSDLTRLVESAGTRAPTSESAHRSWRQLADRLSDSADPPAPLRTRDKPGLGVSDILPHVRLRTSASLGEAPDFRHGDIYLHVSHSGLEHVGVLGELAARGVQPVVMLHDLIPITYPEFCAPGAERRHIRRVGETLQHAWKIIANSRATADEILGQARGLDLSLPDICVAHLGVETEFDSRTASAPLSPGRPYFVHVGTLEPRKNLTFLLAVWRRLGQKLGASAPRLVLAGRRGWEIESIVDHLERSREARRLVFEVSGLDDAMIALLIGSANALVSPSRAEGFNLPIAEALALGTPVIASDIPVHRELAYGCELIDPLDGPAWAHAIESAAERHVRLSPRPAPGWAQHFAIIEAALGVKGRERSAA